MGSLFCHGEGANYRLLSPPLLKGDKNFRDNKHASLREKMNEPRPKVFSGRFDINLVALWVGKERALKPSLQLFITLDQKVCLIPELRFPIPTLLNRTDGLLIKYSGEGKTPNSSEIVAGNSQR